MTACRAFATLALIATSLLGSGCASFKTSLAEVREFADQSARVGAYGELSKRYRDTYLREQAYLPPVAQRLARDNHARRAAVHDDFIAMQSALVLYMQTLSMLAGDERFDLSPQIDALGKSLSALADTGLERKHVAAYTGLTRLLARTVSSNYQGRSVASMVQEGDEHVRVLLEGMMTLTQLYHKTHQNEKKTVLGLFDSEIPLLDLRNERMLASIAKAHHQEKSTEYRLMDRRFASAREGLDKVALGHSTMHKQLDQLHSAELRRMLAAYARDLRLIHASLAD